MLDFHSSDLWRKVRTLAANGHRKYGAVAYFTDNKVGFGAGDVLVVDASDRAITERQTTAAALRAAHRRKVRIFSSPGLHAKTLCLGRHVVVGSANLSRWSEERLVEAAVVSDNPRLLATSRKFILDLADRAKEIDEAFLARIEALPIRMPPPLSVKRQPKRVQHVPQAWLVGVYAMDAADHPDEVEDVERGEELAQQELGAEDSSVGWLRFVGNSGFRRAARAGDSVVQIYRPAEKARGATVYYPVPILRRQQERSCTRFYIEEFADGENRAIPWSEFAKMWKRISDNALPSIHTSRRLTRGMLDRLWQVWPS